MSPISGYFALSVFLFSFNCLNYKSKNGVPVFGIIGGGTVPSDASPTDTPDTTEYTVSGTVTGLTGTGFIITNNGSDDLSISGGSANFTFASKLRSGKSYIVAIKTYPSSPSQACAITNPSGTIQSANVTNISINCTTGYTVSGTVSGLTGTLVLQNNSSDNLSISANGAFPAFSAPLLNLSAYSVTVNSPPSGQVCYIAQGTGTITASNVTNVDIQCTTGSVPPGPLVGGTIVKELVPQFGNDNPNAGSPFAGSVGAASTTNGTGTVARFSGPYQITTDGVYIYVADRNNHSIRRIRISDALVDTFANDSGNNIDTPTGITTDGVNVYVATQVKCQIVKIKISTGAISVIGGGAAYSCGINLPLAMTIDGANLYITAFSGNKIFKLDVNTLVTTTIVGTGTAGFGDNVVGTSATISGPRGIIKVGDFLYVSTGGHSIRKIDLTSGTYSVTTLAGSTAGINGADDGTGPTARFFSPFAISSDGTNLYVADSGNKTIRKIVISSGVVTTLAGCDSAGAATVIGSGNPSVSCTGTARFREPSGMTSDGSYLYVSDDLDHIIRRIE